MRKQPAPIALGCWLLVADHQRNTDTAYDGEVFNIALSDVPERKNDLVGGRYELPAPDGPTTIAVKIIDMLGEEVLVTKDV